MLACVYVYVSVLMYRRVRVCLSLLCTNVCMCAEFHVCLLAYVDVRKYMYTRMQCMYVCTMYACECASTDVRTRVYARVFFFSVVCVRVGACVCISVYV